MRPAFGPSCTEFANPWLLVAYRILVSALEVSKVSWNRVEVGPQGIGDQDLTKGE